MKTAISIVRSALLVTSVASAIGFVGVLLIWGASTAAGQPGCHLSFGKGFGERFQICARAGTLWLFSDDWPDAQGNPAPYGIVGPTGISGGQSFMWAAGGFEWHFCKLPADSRKIWTATLPIQATLGMLFVAGVISHMLRRRLAGRLNKFCADQTS